MQCIVKLLIGHQESVSACGHTSYFCMLLEGRRLTVTFNSFFSSYNQITFNMANLTNTEKELTPQTVLVDGCLFVNIR